MIFYFFNKQVSISSGFEPCISIRFLESVLLCIICEFSFLNEFGRGGVRVYFWIPDLALIYYVLSFISAYVVRL